MFRFVGVLYICMDCALQSLHLQVIRLMLDRLIIIYSMDNKNKCVGTFLLKFSICNYTSFIVFVLCFISTGYYLRFMYINVILTRLNQKLALIQVMAWNRTDDNTYLNQCWPSSQTRICGWWWDEVTCATLIRHKVCAFKCSIVASLRSIFAVYFRVTSLALNQ